MPRSTSGPGNDAARLPATKTTSREDLMKRHVAARARRDEAVLGSDEFRAAAEEVARIEIAIAALEEPPPSAPD